MKVHLVILIGDIRKPVKGARLNLTSAYKLATDLQNVSGGYYDIQTVEVDDAEN